jgi:hypothetical protein
MENVTIFKRVPLNEGQKIHILDGPRKGDWLVTAVDDKKVVLRCPVTGFTVEWDRFCYHVEEKLQQWPQAE